MKPTLTKILKPLASLRLTVTLLVICCVLVFAGTTAQRDMGIQDVQHEFFHSWVAKIQLHYFQPTPSPGKAYIPGLFPLPGGYTLIFLLLANLLAAHTVRFKLRLNRTGVILIHSGLILLLVGELVTSLCAVESRMVLDVGGSSNYTQDIREGQAELAITDHSPADHDDVRAISQPFLQKTIDGSPLHDGKLPFDVKVARWYDNSAIRGPMEQGADIDRLADRGSFQRFGISSVARFTGTEAERVDEPSAFVTLSRDGTSLGTFLVSTQLDRPQQVSVDGKSYDLSLRFRRYYKPYTVYLKKFTHEVFAGTNTPRDFASEVRLVDPTRHVDREVKIWMNNPLRFAGETFYQQSFANEDRTSILQVVRNPGWMMPYVACLIGALGLVIHFGINLQQFLKRKLAPAEGTVGQARASAAPISGRGKKSKAGTAEHYRLEPPARWPMILVPAAIFGIFLISMIGRMTPPSAPKDGYDWEAFGHLPIQFEGRTQPLDSLARNSLKIVKGREELTYLIKGQTKQDDKEVDVPPVQWMLDVMTKSGRWADYKAIEINHPHIKDTLGLPENQKYFSWREIFSNPENPSKLEEKKDKALEKSERDMDAYDHGMIELHGHLGIYLRLWQVGAIAGEYELLSDPERAETLLRNVAEVASSVDPQLLTKVQADPAHMREAFNQALMAVDRNKLTSAQRQAMDAFIDQSEWSSLLSRLGPNEDLYLAAPSSENGKWQPLAVAVRQNSSKIPDSAISFLRIINDYQREKPEEFNADVAAYSGKLRQQLPAPMAKVDFEAFFNRFDPFLNCAVCYVAIFILTLCSWMFWRKGMARSAFWLLILTFAVHTFGLASRIYISGRPPVTNLYSAAVFIGWAVVLFSIGLELIYKNSIALVSASVTGFLTILLASALASTEGDTMKQLQAVLDTNFWLATHVVCVSLGYTATILAGVLAIIYVICGLAFKSVTRESLKEISRMVYGIVCFAMLFSFVGTILGGIWADQSWGRFWGWDPKENGAVLVVLWNALILHARWSGIAKDRGVMFLAICGNIVTAWSYMGTNMLGIGLHSYGFMQSAQDWLVFFVITQVVLAALALIPMKYWAAARREESLPKDPKRLAPAK